ncbi:hypothetical protein Hanom_Chr16g01480221 [Helianthus anomalus]
MTQEVADGGLLGWREGVAGARWSVSGGVVVVGASPVVVYTQVACGFWGTRVSMLGFLRYMFLKFLFYVFLNILIKMYDIYKTGSRQYRLKIA